MLLSVHTLLASNTRLSRAYVGGFQYSLKQNDDIRALAFLTLTSGWTKTEYKVLRVTKVMEVINLPLQERYVCDVCM